MTRRITVALWTCGQCRKPRGLHHVCTGGRKGRDRIRLTVSVKCPRCGKPALNPLTHTCATRSDFQKRKAAQERQRKAAVRKRKRQGQAARRRARAKERRRQASERRREHAAEVARRRKAAGRTRSHNQSRHEYETCGDPYCTQYGCRVYREGRDRGHGEGQSEGFAEGFSAGLSAH